MRSSNPNQHPSTKRGEAQGGYLIGLCGQTQFGWVIFFGYGGCLIDDGQRLGVAATVSPGGGTPGAAVTGGVLVSNADHVDDIKGAFLCGGVGASALGVGAGVDVCVSPGTDTWTAYAGLGVALEGLPLMVGAEAHFSASYTWVWVIWNHGDWQQWIENQIADAATSPYDHECDLYDLLGGDLCDPTQVFGG